jgi:hypothetical protein
LAPLFLLLSLPVEDLVGRLSPCHCHVFPSLFPSSLEILEDVEQHVYIPEHLCSPLFCHVMGVLAFVQNSYFGHLLFFAFLPAIYAQNLAMADDHLIHW